jgi:UDP-N-acetyl-D-mannosaminuronic acid dehydrogenase
MGHPGLTAGACLRKDFTFSEERSSAPGMLLAVSRVHETVPLFLVKGLKTRLGGSLRDRKVAVLGLSFKRDSDDVRDSLSYKLVRLLERELAHVARHDPHVPADSEPLEAALEGADAVVIATNHSGFEHLLDRLPEGMLLVDPWNVTGYGRVFGLIRQRAAVEPA